MSTPNILSENVNVYELLIVDDFPENLQVLSDILYQHGFDIILATSGQQALTSAKTKIPDLILLDVNMPGMDGFEVCRLLKLDSKTADIPVIFITARTDMEDIINGFEVGAVDYIAKPFRRQELIARVKTHIEVKENRKKLKEINESLEFLVAERTAQLEMAYDELKKYNQILSDANIKLSKLDKAKNDFLALINHELRSPINGISGMAHVLHHSLMDTDYENYTILMKEASEKLIKLSEHALLITSLRVDNYNVKKQSFLLSDLLETVNKHFEDEAFRKQIKLVANVLPENLQLFNDKDLLQSCINILVENSIKHSPAGEMVQIIAKKDSNITSIEIIDKGPGFSDMVIEQLFSFFASEDVLHYNKGCGLGLATAKMIMDTLMGAIEIKNRPTGGAIVKLFFRG